MKYMVEFPKEMKQEVVNTFRKQLKAVRPNPGKANFLLGVVQDDGGFRVVRERLPRGARMLSYDEQEVLNTYYYLLGAGFNEISVKPNYLKVKTPVGVLTIEHRLGGFSVSTNHEPPSRECGTGIVLGNDLTLGEVMSILENVEQEVNRAYAELCPHYRKNLVKDL